ncbi:MAG: RHS repeat-associated core domain-containing protein [Pseudomonadota bacterium]
MSLTRLARFACALLAWVSLPFLVNAEELVGSVGGSFRVDQGGVAHYAIPVFAVPGAGGVRPGISLAYASGATRGWAGEGWGLTGFSSIERCAKTLAQDGSIAAVEYSVNDRYCLDGARLVLESGVYGAANSTYRTEVDQFLRITARAEGEQVPAYFDVERRDGSKVTYGVEASTRIEVQGTGGSGPVRSWLIDTAYDAFGNRVQYRYTEDITTGEVHPRRVDWGDEVVPNGDSPELRYRLHFVWGDRPASDSWKAYRAGAKSTISKRLRSIRSQRHDGSGYQFTRIYKLAYEAIAAEDSGRSRLASVQVCNDFGADCMPVTRFEWQRGMEGWPSIGASSQGRADQVETTRVGDINNDGRQDILIASDGPSPTWSVMVSYGSALIENTTSISADNAADSYLIDYNGDAAMDLMVPDGTWKVYLADGNLGLSPMPVDTGIVAEGLSLGVRVADFNGDGLDDLLYGLDDGLYLRYRDPEATFTSAEFVSGQFLVDDMASYYTHLRDARLIDFDGDGRNDLILRTSALPVPGVPTWNTSGGCHDFSIDLRWSSAQGVAWDVEVREQGASWTALLEDHPDLSYTHQAGLGTFDYQVRAKNVIGIAGGWSVPPLSIFTEPNGCDGNEPPVTPSPRGKVGGDWTVLRYVGAPDGGAFEPMITLSDIDNPLPIDLNGDGLTDLAYGRGGEWHTRLSTGTGLTQEVNADFSSALSANAYVVDADRDGREDIVYYFRGSNMINFVSLRSDGDSLAEQHDEFSVDDILNYDDAGRIRIFDGNGDGYRDIAYYDSSLSQWTVHTHDSDPADLLVRITDGFAKPGGGEGNAVQIAYEPLPDVPGYFSEDASFPTQRNYCGPMRLVTTVTRNDGVGGDYTQTYSYNGGKLSTQGRGFLGFAFHQVRDTRDVPDVWAVYRQDYPYIGLPEEQGISQKLGGKLIERMLTTYANAPLQHDGGRTHMVWRRKQETERYEVGGARNGFQVTDTVVEILESDINTDPDGFGEVHRTTMTVDPVFAGAQHSAVFETSFQSRTDSPCLLPDRIAITRSSAGMSDTRISQATEVNWETCQVVEFHENVENGPEVRKTRFERDSFGNVVRQEVWGGDGGEQSNGPRRVTMIAYDDLGQLPRKITDDPMGAALEREMEWDYALGALSRVRNYAGLWTEFRYDSFGRQVHAIAPDGSYVSTVYDWCGGANGNPYACRESGVALTRQTRFSPSFPGGIAEVDVQVISDTFGRVVGEYTNQGGAATKYPGVVFRYDERGDAVQRSARTARSNPPSHWFDTEYDLIRRIVRSTRPVDQYGRRAESTVQYQEDEVLVTDGIGAQRLMTLDALGRIRSVTDPDPYTGLLSTSGTTHYEYTAFSELQRITDPLGNVTSFTYDGLGHNRTLDDPNSGLWSFDYNVFGQLTHQTSPKAHVAIFDYDDVGRLISRDYPDFWTQWRYDSAQGAGRGQIHTISYEPSPGLVETETYAYDNLGRQIALTSEAMGASTSFSYDEYSRLRSITYPELNGDVPYSVTYAYDSRGRVKHVDDSQGVRVFEIADRWPFDFSGKLGNFTLGNGVSTTFDFDDVSGIQVVSKSSDRSGVLVQRERANLWDNNLNLVERKDTQYDGRRSIFDVAQYDYLDRLTSVRTVRGGNTLTTVEIDYDAIGNIQRKSDVGDYRYASGTPSRLSSVVEGPRALSFDYDDNGNVVAKDEGVGTPVHTGTTWTSFDQPSQIVRGTDAVSLGYNADLEPLQVTQDAAEEPGVSGQWYYTDGLTTFRTDSNSHLYRIPVEGVVIGAADSLSGEVTYYHYDLLDSVVTTTDAAGNLDAEIRFDAFGKRRMLSGEADVTDSLLFGQEVEDLPGFTGHQQRDLVGLVQMNARVYDPTVGRFTSVDPLMRDVLDSRSHNAYAYVENSPLSFTDPTGLALDGPGGGTGPGGGSQGGGGQGPLINASPTSGSSGLFAFVLEIALGTERRIALEEYFLGVGRADEIQFAAGPPSTALVSDLYTTETGFFDRPLGVPGRVGVAALGGAGVVGVGVLLAKTGLVAACVSSVVCAVGVVSVVGGAAVYDLTHGGAERIQDSFVAFFSRKTATIGQSLEVGSLSTAVVGGSVSASRLVLRGRSVPILGHRNGIHEVLVQESVSGVTRSAHRASANRALVAALESDARFASHLGQLLGVDDVAALMRRGPSALRNPPGTEWHHPLDNPAVMQLLRREVHRDPDLREILHPDNIGGFGRHFGGQP